MNFHCSFEDVCAIVPQYDKYGHLYTAIVKKTGIQKVPLSPTQIINQQLLINGSSIRGAKDAACYIMGSTSMHPILMQVHPNLHVLFPSESPRNRTCAYFYLHQIEGFDTYKGIAEETIVYLRGIYAVVIPVSKSKFAARYNDAYRFKGKAYCNHHFPYEANLETKQILKCAEMHESYLV